MGDRILVMIKESSCLGANFGLVIEHFKFYASSQTLSLFLKGTNFC